MIETLDPKSTDKPEARCSECDREVEHYNTHLTSTNEARVVCWECLSRHEKGFNAKRDFRRDARSGVIPR
jgi:DNA-directed RNA polymerase subunit RPC12/RpoP